jgi:hypothetical protein
MAEMVTKGKLQGTVEREEQPAPTLPPVRVAYYRQVKPQRVHTVEVSWQKAPTKGARGEVSVKLIAAGAQVLPSEQNLDVSQPSAKAVFYVTPLVKGWLRNTHIEVLSSGRKVQEIPLATKVVSQRFTWFLLACSFFVPWFITEYIRNSPLAEPTRLPDSRVIYPKISKEVEKYIKDNVPSTDFLKVTPVEAPVKSALLDARSQFATGYQKLVEVCGSEPIAFYVGAILLTLTLISYFMHMQKRGRKTGKPIPVVGLRNLERDA